MLANLFEKIGERFTEQFPKTSAFISRINEQIYVPFNKLKYLYYDLSKSFSFVFAVISFLGRMFPSMIVGSLSGAGAGGIMHQLVVKPQLTALQTETSHLESKVSKQGDQNKQMAVVLANQEKSIQKTSVIVGKLVGDATKGKTKATDPKASPAVGTAPKSKTPAPTA